MNLLRNIYGHICEYCDNDGINPLAAFFLRKSNRLVIIGGYTFYVFLLTILVLFAAAYSGNKEFTTGILLGCSYLAGIFAVLIGFFGANLPMTYSDVGYKGDETFRLIYVPYLERWHTGILLCIVSGLMVPVLTFPAVVIVFLIDFDNYNFLFIPLVQIGIVWTLMLLTVLVQGIYIPFRKQWENFLMFIIAVIPTVMLFIGFVLLNWDLLHQELNRRAPAHPYIFTSALVVSALFLFHLWAAVSYFLIRYYLLHPRKGICEVLSINSRVHSAVLLLIFAAAMVLMRFY